MAKKLTKKKYKAMRTKLEKIQSKMTKLPEENFCSSCGVDLRKNPTHKNNCTKYQHQWIFTFDDEHKEFYHGNTKEQAKQDMVNHYEDLIKSAKNTNLDDNCEMFENITSMEKMEAVKLD